MNDFIKLLNSYWAGETFQIIPANNFTQIPSPPFATWAFVDEYSKIIDDDLEREIVDDKVILKAERYHRPTINFKVYSYNKTEANTYCEDLRNCIEFSKRDEIVKAKYGIISIDRTGQSNEKLESGQNIYCYILRLTFDFNEIIAREYDLLEEVGIKGDVNNNIDWR